MGQDFPRESQKNNIKIFSLRFCNEEMKGWKDYLGVKHQNTVRKAGHLSIESKKQMDKQNRNRLTDTENKCGFQRDRVQWGRWGVEGVCEIGEEIKGYKLTV